MYDLGYRIRETRTQRGISQSELAKRINKSKSAVCGYESNGGQGATSGIKKQVV